MKNYELSINTIRIIGNEAINQASSGHPGMVLSSACISYCLFNEVLNITSKEPNWINRDRFVLGSGHASAMLYTNLHLLGYKVSIEDIKKFRQLGSNTPGHPEYGITDGVDCSSGPLGQGIGHAVGLAIAEKFLAEKYNKPKYEIFSNYTYCLCGDGDFQEGVSLEAMAIASRLDLNKLIVIYDKNNVTLDGKLELSSDDDLVERFKSLNWNVIECDGLDYFKVQKALKKAKTFKSKPTIIVATTIMGYLSTNAGTNKVHGSPLKDDLDNVKKKIGWNYKPFEIPQEVYEDYKENGLKRGHEAYRDWEILRMEYKNKFPNEFKEIEKIFTDKYLQNLSYPKFNLDTTEATRQTFGKVINNLAPQIPTLIGGAGDVAGSVQTLLKDYNKFVLEPNGRNIYFGIREFAMSLAQSGMLLYGGVRPFVGSFLVFVDYFKQSIRTAALMHLPSINILTHDSIAVGEDGPTHQPIEQINSLRLIPSTYTIRPSGAIETSHAVRFAIENKKDPVNLILSRQSMSIPCEVDYETFKKGAYIVKFAKKFDYVLVATGSEVGLALEAAKILEAKRKRVQVVSMPCVELFEKQDAKFKKEILGKDKDKVVAIEMGSTALWYKYANKVIGIDEFGASGKASDVLAHFGFTPSNVASLILE